MLSTKIGKLSLTNPLMNASGTFGSGEEYADFFAIGELGAVVSKSVTLHETLGNPPPRVVETFGGMLNAIGLQNAGLDYFIKSLLPQLRERAKIVVVNVAGKSAEDYCAVIDGLSAQPIDALEINISCPNVKAGGIAFGTSAKIAGDLIAQLKKVTPLPLWVKLSPNVTDIAEIARAVEQNGADALTVANTFLGMAIDIEKRRPLLSNITGGLSGIAIHPLALRCVWQVAQAVKCPIIACGGVESIREVLAFLMAGASAVQVGMANFNNPQIMPQLLHELSAWCAKHNTNVNNLIGSANVHAVKK